MAITGNEIVTCKQFADSFGIETNGSSFSSSPISIKQAKLLYFNLTGKTFDETAKDDEYSTVPLTISQMKLMKTYFDSAYSYATLEWLGLDGNQLIDTDFYPTGNTRLLMDCYIDSSNPNGVLFSIFGGRTSNTSATFSLWRIDASHFRYDYGSSQYSISLSPANGRFTIDANKNVLSLNDKKYSYTSKSFTSSHTLRIASNYTTDGETSNRYDARRFSGKIYYAKIYNSSTLVRDYIPAERISDKTLGLYDKIEKKFYVNDGSGSFTSGPKIGYI